MTINDRINNTRPYFRLFNVAENVAYSMVVFPDMWKAPQSIAEKHNIQIKPDNKEGNGFYYFVDLDENIRGIDAIFDAIDYTIEFNKAIEERAAIFTEKANELKELVYSLPIEDLKSLKFIIDKPSEKKTKGKGRGRKAKKEDVDIVTKTLSGITLNETVVDTQPTENVITTEKEEVVEDDCLNTHISTNDNDFTNMVKELV